MVIDKDIPWKRILVEAAAIVASILLAFAIDAWWETRREDDLATSYIDRLKTDIEVDLDAYEVTVEWSAAMDTSSMYILDIYRGKDPTSETYDLFIYHMFRATWNMRGRTSSETYEDLVSTGNLGLLPIRLRNEIGNYYSEKTYYDERVESYSEIASHGFWRVPDITLGPDIGPRIWESIQGNGLDFLPEVGSLELSDANMIEIVKSLRDIDDLETQVAEVRHQMSQRKILFGERLPNAARHLLEVLASVDEID